MITTENKIHLFALYVKEESDYYFAKYFWEYDDAFVCGESASYFLERKITGYKIQKHLVPVTKSHTEILDSTEPINNYIILSDG